MSYNNRKTGIISKFFFLSSREVEERADYHEDLFKALIFLSQNCSKNDQFLLLAYFTIMSN